MLPFNIIIEGMDNSGKTTLIKKLMENKAFGKVYKVIPSTGYTPNIRSKVMEEIFHDTTSYKIYDRHPLISEYIYGPIIRGSSKIRQAEVQQLMSHLFDNNRTLLIWCYPPPQVLKESLSESDQMEGVVSNADGIIDSYYNFMTSYVPPASYIGYDYTTDPHASILIEYIFQYHS